MKWLIDIVKEWIEAQGYLTTSYVDAGDRTMWDYKTVNFTRDGAWHDLSLVARVPEGAKAVHLMLEIKSSAVQKAVRFRKKGNIHIWNKCYYVTQIVDFAVSGDCIVTPDANRVIEYWASDETITMMQMIVRGWWL